MDAAYIFNQGAEAMRAEIAARLTVMGKIDIAVKILQLPLPKFQLSEQQTLGKKE